MKKFWIITTVTALVVVMMGCSKVRRSPGRVYMPDMAYSRAIETYSSTEALQKHGIHYTAMPVAGTIARGDMAAYELQNDSAGYINSKNIANPLPALEAKQFIEGYTLSIVVFVMEKNWMAMALYGKMVMVLILLHPEIF
jgi:hypothetical protein